MSTVDKLRLNYPLPITKLYTAVQLETDPRLQAQKLIELFEGLVRYLALIGLASYTHQQLVHPEVERLRAGLARPSLGHWVNLLRTISAPLASSDLHLLGDTPDRNRNSDVIGEGTRQLTKMLDQPSKAGRLKLDHFLSTVVEFRNKKFGHGSLSKPQAREIVEPLEQALLLWLDELTLLEQRKLVYLAQVELQEEGLYKYHGYNLNAGDSPLAFSPSGAKPLPGNRIYLYNSVGEEFLTLHPFFVFDDDFRLLYIYSEISSRDMLVLRCPYELPGAEIPREVAANKTIIIGVGRPVAVAAPASAEGSEKPTETPAEVAAKVSNERPQSETDLPSSASQSDVFDKSPSQTSSSPPNLPPQAVKVTFDDIVQQLERRIRQVCRPQARYPVLWVVGEPCSGKTAIARAVCQRAGWRHIDFTLEPGCLDSLEGQEETYRPEDFLTYLKDLCKSDMQVVILDEIEPVLGWWPWDEQEVFFRKIAKATRLKCGVVLITRLRNTQQLEKIVPGKNQIFEVPQGVEP